MTTNGKTPLVDLWAERNRLVALVNAAETQPDIDAAADKVSAIEGRIANAKAKTLAGVLVQVKLHYAVVGDGTWLEGDALMCNVIASLERMDGAA